MNQQGNSTRRWLPLIALLVSVGLFDLLAMTSVTSLETKVFASIFAVSYTQTLLSAIWLSCGFGQLGGRAMAAFIFLLAAVATITFYIAGAVGPSIADWLSSIAAIFVVGLLTHWSVCVLAFGISRMLGWRLVRCQEESLPRTSDAQFGIRTILIWTAMMAIGFAAVRTSLNFADWRLTQFQKDGMMISVTFSSLCVPLHLFATFGLLVGGQFLLRLVVIGVCLTFLTWVEVETMSRLFNSGSRNDYIFMNAYLFALIAAFALAARYAGLRLARQRSVD